MLATIADYITEARVLLNDSIAPMRYPDTSLVSALGLGLSQLKRIRPDLTLGVTFPVVVPSTVTSTTIPLDEQYRFALLNFMVGYAQLRDEEGGSEQRAAMFILAFTSQLANIV